MTPTLTAPGIVLRPLMLADAADLFIALGDADVQLYRRQSAHADVAETERYIVDTLERSRAAWAITVDGGEAFGRLALRTPEPGIGEFGIVLRAAAQRRGLGLKALALAEVFAFGELRLHKLRAAIDAENAASIALFAKADFLQTALLPSHERTKLGLRDRVVMEKRLRQA